LTAEVQHAAGSAQLHAMSRTSVINLGLQVAFAALRYTMMGWVYSHSDLETVGHINALLTYITAATFVAGFELHQVVNRSLLLEQGNRLRWGVDRQLLAIFVIGVMAWTADAILFGVNRGLGFAALVLLVTGCEYLALEFGRLLIAKSRFVLVTVCGFVRSVAPFLAVVVTSPTLEAMLVAWLLGALAVLAFQGAVLWRAAYFFIEWRPLHLSSYRSAALFFAAGVLMALMPTVERWLAGTFFTASVLGQ
jgi:hypothetical protein